MKKIFFNYKYPFYNYFFSDLLFRIFFLEICLNNFTPYFIIVFYS